MSESAQPESMQYEEEAAAAAPESCAGNSEAKEEASGGDKVVDAALEKEIRSRMAAKRQAKILAQMQMAQKNFMDTNADLFAITTEANAAPEDEKEKAADRVSGGKQTDMDWDEAVPSDKEAGAAACPAEACLGFGRRVQHYEEERLKCILCFEDAKVSKKGEMLVYLAYVQRSKVCLQHNEDHANLVVCFIQIVVIVVVVVVVGCRSCVQRMTDIYHCTPAAVAM